MNSYLISVIVPVYNVSSYLRKCLDSIISQTYTLLEIIIVDDGSQDGSSQICDDYSTLDPRIHVIHKTNGGLSSARNEGLKYATGEYVSFVDSDDWLERDHFKKMSTALFNEVDIIIGDYSIEYKGKIYTKCDSLINGLYKDKDIKDSFLVPLISRGEHMPVWTNLYSTKLIKKLNLTFFSEREVYAEDDLFNTAIFASCHSVYKINSCSYIHLIVAGSLSQSYRKGLYTMLQKKRMLKKSLLLSMGEKEMIEILDKTEANEVAYCLFKESLCDYKLALNNIRSVCDSATRVFQGPHKPSGKYAILYYLGKKRVFSLIVLTSKAMNLSQPIYRFFSIR